MRAKLVAAVALSSIIAMSTPVSANIPFFNTNKDEIPTLAPMLEDVTPAVVNISVKGTREIRQRVPEIFRYFFGPNGPREQVQEQPFQGLGSGVIIDADNGYVVTNNHVIDSATEILVTLKDGRQFDATVVGTDKRSDIALLKIKDGEDLTEIPIGKSSALRVGDFVVAIGNPFGLGQTVTSGIVSALDRSGLGIEEVENFIQTDAAINPGNSGGALVDTRGHLIGINTAIYSRSGGSMGIGFAIPVNTAKEVMESIIKNGSVVRGWIGVEPMNISAEMADTLKITAEGVLINGTLKGGPADKAGIQPGDVLKTINNKSVNNITQLLKQISEVPPGDKIKATINRKGKNLDIEIQVGKRPGPKRK